jgi:hypothetical protein
MMLSNTTRESVGRRVRIVGWEHGQFIAAYLGRVPLGGNPQGTVVHVEMIGEDDGDVWVKVDGLDREFAFGIDQLEYLT